MKALLIRLLCILYFTALAGPISAQDASTISNEADANNPLANTTAFNLQNYYIPELSDLDGEHANTFWLRYAKPVGGWLIRTSLPISSVPTVSGSNVSGLGDLNTNFFYLIDTGKPGVSLGIGPQLTLPTSTKDETGSNKVQAGLSAVYFNASSAFFQWGGLLNWQTSIGGSDEDPDSQVLAIQPFYFFQLGKGYYVRGAPIWVFDLENDNYHVPIGLGLGKVVPSGNKVFNFFVEPQFTILHDGPGQPEFQLFMAVNMQFK